MYCVGQQDRNFLFRLLLGTGSGTGTAGRCDPAATSQGRGGCHNPATTSAEALRYCNNLRRVTRRPRRDHEGAAITFAGWSQGRRDTTTTSAGSQGAAISRRLYGTATRPSRGRGSYHDPAAISS